MTSPGGAEVGRVSIRVVADTSGFHKDVRDAVALADKETAQIKITGDFDADGLRQQVRTAVAAIQENVEIGIQLTNRALRANLRSIVETSSSGIRARIPIEWATTAGQLRNALRVLIAQAELGQEVRIPVVYDENAIGNLGRQLSNAGSSFSNSIRPRTFLQIIGYLVAATAAAGPLVTAGAAVTAAWGAASTAIAAIPGLIALIGIPAATIALGFDSFANNFAQLADEIQLLEAVVNNAFDTSLSMVVTNLEYLLRNLGNGFRDVASALGGMLVQISNVLVSAEGMERIKRIFEDVAFAVTLLGPAMATIVETFIRMADHIDAVTLLTRPLITFAGEFSESVDRLAADGDVLTRAFDGLGAVLDSLTVGFVELVENGIRVFAAAAPGVVKFLDSLNKFFAGFDWERLGTAVGNVFAGIGETLDMIPPSTIEAITQAFERLGDTFRDPVIQEGFAAIADVIPLLLDLLNQLIIGFSTVALALTKFAGVLGGVGRAFGAFKSLLSGDIGFGDFLAQLGQAGIDVKTNFDALWDIIEGEYGPAERTARGVIDALRRGFNAFGETGSFFQETGKQIFSEIDTFVAGLQTKTPAISDALKPGDKDYVDTANAWVDVVNGVYPAIDIAWGSFVLPGIRNVVGTGSEAMKPPVTGETIPSAWSGAVNQIPPAITSAGESVFAAASSLATGAGTAITEGLAPIPGNATTTLQPLGNAADVPMTTLQTNLTAGMEGGRQAVATGSTNIGTEAGTIQPNIQSNTSGLNASLLVAAGRAVMDGLLNGIVAAAQAVYNYVAGIAARIAALKGPLAYDRKLLIPAGKAIMGGLRQGLVTGFSAVNSFVSSVAPRIQSAIGGLEMDTSFADAMSATLNPHNTFSPDLSAQYSTAVQGEGVGAQVAQALAGWNVVIDPDGIARLVNKSNTRRAAR